MKCQFDGLKPGAPAAAPLVALFGTTSWHCVSTAVTAGHSAHVIKELLNNFDTCQSKLVNYL